MDLDDIKNQPCLVLVNGSFFFSPEERIDIENHLKDDDISFVFFEKRGFQNNILSGIEIVLNDPLINLLIGGLVMPVVYDNLKKVIQLTIKRIRNGKVRTITASNSSVPNILLKIPTKKGEIIASIDRELSEEETDAYLKALIKAADSVDENDNYNSIYRVIDDLSDGTLEILTLNEYLKKHHKIK